jgi:hypothetical protein
MPGDVTPLGPHRPDGNREQSRPGRASALRAVAHVSSRNHGRSRPGSASVSRTVAHVATRPGTGRTAWRAMGSDRGSFLQPCPRQWVTSSRCSRVDELGDGLDCCSEFRSRREHAMSLRGCAARSIRSGQSVSQRCDSKARSGYSIPTRRGAAGHSTTRAGTARRTCSQRTPSSRAARSNESRSPSTWRSSARGTAAGCRTSTGTTRGCALASTSPDMNRPGHSCVRPRRACASLIRLASGPGVDRRSCRAEHRGQCVDVVWVAGEDVVAEADRADDEMRVYDV